MSLQLVIKSVTLNGVNCNKFGKLAFQLITASSSIELIDQKLAFMTHRAVKLVCVTKFMHSGWSEFEHYLLSIYCL